MISALVSVEKRSFYLFIVVLIVVFTFLLSDAHPSFLSLGAVMMGLFGFFRLTYLLEYRLINMPAFLSLPSRLIFGLHQAEDQHKKNIWKLFQQKEIFLFILLGFFYGVWFLYCSFSHDAGENLPHEIAVFFETDMPALLPLSYLNMYEVIRHILYFNLFALILFLSLSYGAALPYFKGIFLLLFGIFMFLFGWLLVQSDLILSLPPFYTLLIEGIGFGKAEIIYQSQPDIFLYPLTGLFKNYIEGGLVGLFLLYALHGVMAVSLLTIFFDEKYACQTQRLWSGAGLFCLVLLLVTHITLSAPALINAFQALGFALIGLCWGAAQSGPTQSNSQST